MSRIDSKSALRKRFKQLTSKSPVSIRIYKGIATFCIRTNRKEYRRERLNPSSRWNKIATSINPSALNDFAYLEVPVSRLFAYDEKYHSYFTEAGKFEVFRPHKQSSIRFWRSNSEVKVLIDKLDKLFQKRGDENFN